MLAVESLRGEVNEVESQFYHEQLTAKNIDIKHSLVYAYVDCKTVLDYQQRQSQALLEEFVKNVDQLFKERVDQQQLNAEADIDQTLGERLLEAEAKVAKIKESLKIMTDGITEEYMQQYNEAMRGAAEVDEMRNQLREVVEESERLQKMIDEKKTQS